MKKTFKDPHAMLLRILEIIDYQGDKNQFAWEFIDLCARKAMLNCITAVPKDDRDKIDTALKEVKTIEDTITVLTQHIPKTSYEKHLEEVSKLMFRDYINTVFPTLNPSQQKALTDYLTQISA